MDLNASIDQNVDLSGKVLDTALIGNTEHPELSGSTEFSSPLLLGSFGGGVLALSWIEDYLGVQIVDYNDNTIRL